MADDEALEASRSKHEGDYMLLQKVVALFSKSKRGEIEARLAFKRLLLAKCEKRLQNK